MTRASLRRLTAGALPLLFGLSAAVAQEEGAFDRTPVDCIRVISIDQTQAIDDQNILFHMNGKRVYRNHLPRTCPGLKRQDRIAYQVYSGGRLCSIDTITVLEQFGGGLQPGFTCRLGEFVPLSPEEIEDLKREDDQPGPEAIETESLDLERTAEPSADTESEPAEPVDND